MAMSMRFVAERYKAYRITLRISISDDYETSIHVPANSLAEYAELVFGTDGSTITIGNGRWRNETELAAVIEIVTREQPINSDMEKISQFVNLNFGLTCFATVDETEAFELYEMAE
jgi:hypothetical protein